MTIKQINELYKLGTVKFDGELDDDDEILAIKHKDLRRAMCVSLDLNRIANPENQLIFEELEELAAVFVTVLTQPDDDFFKSCKGMMLHRPNPKANTKADVIGILKDVLETLEEDEE